MNESYVTNAEADDYFEFRYNSPLWDTLDETTKTKLLVTSSRYLTKLNWAGDKADATQALEFPRGTDTTIPVEIKNGVCEIAYALLDGRDVEYEQELLSHTRLSASVFGVSLDAKTVDVARIHGIPSSLAWSYFRPFLRDGSVVTLVRMD